MLEMLEPIATAVGYIVLIPALAFVTIAFLCAGLAIVFLTLRWVAGEQLRRRARALMSDELKDMKRISEATPDEFSEIFSRSSSSDVSRDYLD